MFIVWFKKDGEWHWVEIFQHDTANILRQVLIAHGFEVTKTNHDPRKYSLIQQGEK